MVPLAPLRYSGAPPTKTMKARPGLQSPSFLPLPVHHGGSPRTVRVPNSSTSRHRPEPERGPQDHGPHGDTLPLQPTDVVRGTFLSGEGAHSLILRPQED